MHSNTIYNMPNILKITIIIIMVLIAILIGYIAYLYKKEIEKNKGEIKKNTTKNITVFKNQEFNKITKKQKEILLIIVKSRLKALENAQRLDADELEILSKLIEKRRIRKLEWFN